MPKLRGIVGPNRTEGTIGGDQTSTRLCRRVTIITVEGVPADEICTLAENENIDLIVMSSHGRTGLSRVLVGSVAEKVLRAAKCPVLIVKQPGNAEANVVTEPGQTKAVTDETSAAFKKV